MEPMLDSAAQASKSCSVACFGQDTTRLYSRAGKRAWRAQVPPSDAQKREGAAAATFFGVTYSLATLSLEAVEQAHVSYLNALLEADPGPSKSRVLLRLRLAAESADRLSRLVRLAPNSEYALPGCTTFISSCRDEPHGRRVVMSQKPREHPFPAGSFKGARPGARPHVLHFPKPSLPADDARNGGPRIPLSMWVPPCMGAEPPALAPRTHWGLRGMSIWR